MNQLFNNLQTILNRNDNEYLIIDDNKILTISKEEYDTIDHNKDLTIYIHYTLSNILETLLLDEEMPFKRRMFLLNVIDSSINNLFDYYNEINIEDEEFTDILHKLDEFYEYVYNQYNYRFKFLYKFFDTVVDTLRGCDKYLYFTPYGQGIDFIINDNDEDNEDLDDDDNEDDEDLDNEYYSDNDNNDNNNNNDKEE